MVQWIIICYFVFMVLGIWILDLSSIIPLYSVKLGSRDMSEYWWIHWFPAHDLLPWLHYSQTETVCAMETIPHCMSIIVYVYVCSLLVCDNWEDSHTHTIICCPKGCYHQYWYLEGSDVGLFDFIGICIMTPYPSLLWCQTRGSRDVSCEFLWV